MAFVTLANSQFARFFAPSHASLIVQLFAFIFARVPAQPLAVISFVLNLMCNVLFSAKLFQRNFFCVRVCFVHSLFSFLLL